MLFSDVLLIVINLYTISQKEIKVKFIIKIII